MKRLQESTFDEFSKRRLIENQDIILELTATIRELQNEVNFLNDSRDFKDAESVRSGLSHVPSVFPTSSSSWWNAKPFSGNAQPQRQAAKYLGHAWYIGKRFRKSSCVLFSTLSSRIESMEFIDRGAASFIHSGTVKGEHRIKIRDASLDSQPKIQSSSVEETLQRIMGQTNNNDCRFRIFTLTSSLHQRRLLAGR